MLKEETEINVQITLLNQDNVYYTIAVEEFGIFFGHLWANDQTF